MKKVRVLVVDDSAFMRRILSDIITSEGSLELSGTARDGVDALNKIKIEKPDVVTLDIEMPRLDGFETLKRIVNEYSLPVVMLSSLASKDSEITMKALEAGAVDFISKPGTGFVEDSLEELRTSVVQKILAASAARVELITSQDEIKIAEKIPEPFSKRTGKDSGIIVAIGASTGGPKALEAFFRALPAGFNSTILLCQHMPPGFTYSFSQRLDMLSPIKVKEANEGDRLISGRALLAPGDFHMIVDNNTVHLNKSPKVNYVRPSIDVMLESLVVCEQRVIVVIMTGMGKDGATGALKLKKAKKDTIVLVQHPASALIPSMPEALIKAGICDNQVPLERLAAELGRLISIAV